tara:strand:+ start:4457 stop:5224 length:768 start_codon:yes stop_codon:yes gene_type:complete
MVKYKVEISNDKIEFYKKNGWVVLEKIFNKNEVSFYKKKIFDYLKKNHKKFSGRDINYSSNSKTFEKISSFHNLQSNKSIKKISEKGVIFEIAKKLLNKTPELRASELFIKKKNLGKPTPIHQDDYYWNVKNNEGLTIWVALTPSNKSNGSVFYFSKSHKKGIQEHTPSFIKGSSQKIKKESILSNFKKITPKINQGDVVIHNSLVFHGSHKSRSNLKRIGWTFAFKPKSSYYDIERTKKYEKKLYDQITLREAI